MGGSGRVREKNLVPDVLSEELTKLATRIHEMADKLDEEQKIELTSAANRCLGLGGAVQQWLAQDLEEAHRLVEGDLAGRSGGHR